MNRSLIILITACSLVAACSSGGQGNGGQGNGGQAPPADMAITPTNAELVTRVSYTAALASASLGELSGETGLIAAGPGSLTKISGSVSVAANSNVTLANVPLPDQILDCDGGGTITVSADIADLVTFNLSPGDTFGVAFDMCNDNLGTITDGDFDYVVDAFVGDFLSQLYDLTMSLTLTNFQVTTTDDVLNSNGGATVQLNALNAPAVAIALNGASLTVDTNSSSETQIDFLSSQTLDAGISPSPYTMISSGTLDSTQLTGVVQYSTPTMFEGFDADYPHAGVFLVTGGNNSSARLTAIDNVNVRIDIDTNGDGTIDDTINTTWVELDGGQAGIM